MNEDDCNCPPPGAPAWLGTFADLMSLLMCFFVLLLAFSEMDLSKYKQVAGSMREAFGVQREVFAKETPMGTSFVAREFTPGKPDESPITPQMNQQSALQQQKFLEVNKEGTPDGKGGAGEGDAAALEEGGLDGDAAGSGAEAAAAASSGAPSELREYLQHLAKKEAEADADKFEDELQAEMDQGLLDVLTEGRKIIVRIQEKGSFAAGSAELQEPFGAVLAKIARLLESTPGRIVVTGHTDNSSASGKYRSSWELSAARAVSVVDRILREGVIERDRLTVEGKAETAPIANNDSWEGRALNRRVEVTLIKGRDIELDDVDILG